MLLAEAGIDADGHNFQMCHRNLISSPPLALPSLLKLTENSHQTSIFRKIQNIFQEPFSCNLSLAVWYVTIVFASEVNE